MLNDKNFLKKLRIRKFDAQTEKEFNSDYNKKSVTAVQLTLGLILFIGIIPYAALDKIIIPETFRIAWFIRFGIWTPVILISLYLSFKPLMIKHLQRIAIIANLTLCYGVLIMILMTEKSEIGFTKYYAGLTVTLSTMIMLRIRYKAGIWILFSVIFSYLIIAVFKQKMHLPHENPNFQAILINNIYFLFSVALAIGIAVYMLEIYTRFNFWHRKQLIKEKYLIQEKTEQIKKQNEQIRIQSQEVAEIYQTKNKLFSIIAHDLKNPFNSIIGFSDLLLESCENNDQKAVKRFSRIIRDTSTNTFDLLNNLLDWSKIQTNKITLNPQEINIKDLVDEMVEYMYDFAKQKGILLQAETFVTINIWADLTMIQTVLRNLISNAIKYSSKGDVIEIKIANYNRELKISVSDTGLGIPDEDKKKLFKISDSISKLGTNNEKGTGLGLLLCQNFIKLHEGKIWVDSIEGKGSTFSFTLPKIKNPDSN